MTGRVLPYILVVEDNASDVELFRLSLSEVGLDCELAIARDGAEGIHWVEALGPGSRTPDLAVIDLNLPRYDGFEVLSKIRNTRVLDGMPVMVLSSSVSPRDIARARAFAQTAYVPKPVDLDEYVELGNTVRGMLARQSTAAPE